MLMLALMQVQLYFIKYVLKKKITECRKKIFSFLKVLFIIHLHLSDAFIQSDLHCIQVTVTTFFIRSCFPWESNP